MIKYPINTFKAILYRPTRTGADLNKIIETMGIDPSDLDDPVSNISHDRQMMIWDEVARHSGDRYWGLHLAENIPMEMFGVIAQLAQTSATLGQALKGLVRYGRLIYARSEVKLEIADTEARLSYRLACPPWFFPRQVAEGAMAAIWLSARKLSGPSFSLEEVCFQHSPPEDTREHERIFSAPVGFGRAFNDIVFKRELLELPIKGSDVSMNIAFNLKAQKMLAELPIADPFIDEVRSVIYNSLSSGNLVIKSIARKFDMSPSMLRRHLVKKETTYQYLLSSMRCELAMAYLQNRSWSLSDVALSLGFSSSASFKRTFTRWLGQTPSEYRRTLFDSVPRS